ncbi:3-dehydroquinate synthase [Synechococcus sp. RSCCF101]|uniref:3-dehydroquinate synthase n=1 Tax=Synechococcus sp. RSCCF101 TaxID=2511069 RepID=UPI001248B1EE|nr:3-dehydroquinate synthase [Synechococcus sp. RSCCF101]QEY31665.1 3-dehydroquinate synthase [Synechococcus sp. RSCCF101]
MPRSVSASPTAAAIAPLQTVTVDLPAGGYPIHIGSGALSRLGPLLRERGWTEGRRVLVVSNPDVAGPYGAAVRASLESVGLLVHQLVLEAGEEQKTPRSIGLIHDAAFAARLERSSLMLALGGGVVGDMTGFAAATWLRGLAVVQVPTTLLAMVDAAIGGKTGVNHPGGKNLIGAFHQPDAVVVDPDTLATLPVREFRAGMAEVIKYGVIGDPALFENLEASEDPSSREGLGAERLQEVLQRCAAAKAEVVAADEREAGRRAVLNYGHTLGHVVETLSGYGRVLHGEAVAIGMVAAGALSVELGLWSPADQERQRRLIAACGLPVRWPGFEAEAALRCLRSDKKVRDGRVRFVLPSGLGSVVIRDDISDARVLQVLERLV